MRRILLILCASLLTLTVALAQSDQGYYYRLWTTDATLSANNTLTISEHYTVNYTEARHGIFRYLQNEFGANRNVLPDGEGREVRYYRYRPEIEVTAAGGDDVDINESDENDCTVIRWGNADRLVTGEHYYSLDYTYRTPDDRIEARDYIFHTLIPSDVRTRIEVLRFNVQFEKPLPADIADRLQIFCGPYGSEQRAHVENLVVTPTRISGELRDVPSFNAVTLYAELPEGYYTDTLKRNPLYTQILFYLALALVLLLLYYEFNDAHERITPSVEFYAPEGVTPVLVGKIIDGSTDDIDIAAMIPWLAQQGYLEIHDIPGTSGLFGKKDDVELRKLRDVPDDAPKYQQKIMYLLFKKGDVLRMSEIGDRHSQVASAKSAVDSLFHGDKSLSEYKHFGTMLGVIAASTACLATASSVTMFYEDNLLCAAFWGISFVVAWLFRVMTAERNLFKSGLSKTITTLGRILCFLVILVIVYAGCFDSADQLILPWQAATLTVLCFIACEFSHRTVFDTPYRAEMAGKLLGFREFISTAEKDRLQMLVDKDPAYFYSVLPYAMIFGLTEKWCQLFRDIQVEPQPWYPGMNGMNNLQHSITNLSNTLSKSISTSAVDHTKSSSYGGGGGGGFSGGGGGGGGAGSW